MLKLVLISDYTPKKSSGIKDFEEIQDWLRDKVM